MTKLKMAQDWKDYWDRAEQWADQQDWSYYNKDRNASVRAVAMFMANQDGVSVMEGWVGTEYKKV